MIYELFYILYTQIVYHFILTHILTQTSQLYTYIHYRKLCQPCPNQNICYLTCQKYISKVSGTIDSVLYRIWHHNHDALSTCIHIIGFLVKTHCFLMVFDAFCQFSRSAGITYITNKSHRTQI